MYNYVEIIRNGVYNRGDVHKLPDSMPYNFDLNYYHKEVKDAFHSAYMHSQELQDYVEQNNGVLKGYPGKVKACCFWWDMDNEDIEKARKDTILLCDRLKKYNEGNIRIYFSGGKGFHVLYTAVAELDMFETIPHERLVKSFCTWVARGLDSFDGSVYDKTRIIRTPLSKHSKTNLYKIPVSYPILTANSAKNLQIRAEEQHSIVFLPSFDENNALLKDIVEVIETGYRGEKSENNKDRYDDIIEGIENGLQGGKRNNTLFSLASNLNYNGVSKRLISSICNLVNNNSSDPLPDDEISAIISSATKYESKKVVIPEVKGIKTVEQAAKDWTRLIKMSGDFSFGSKYEHINKPMEVTLLGDVVGLLGASGSAKSTLLLDMLNEYAKIENCRSLFLSLEMSAASSWFRMSQMCYEANEDNVVNSKELAYNLLHDAELMEEIKEAWKRLLIIEEGMNIQQLGEWIAIAKDKFPDIRMVGVDFLQTIDGMSDISKAIRIVKDIKNIAKANEVIICQALQTNKTISNPYIEPSDENLEGAVAIKQSLDYLMTIWRSKERKELYHGKFLKTRWSHGDVRFSMLRDGLKYNTIDEEIEKPSLSSSLKGIL